jgi:hypothetical protein
MNAIDSCVWPWDYNVEAQIINGRITELAFVVEIWRMIHIKTIENDPIVFAIFLDFRRKVNV